MDVLIFIVVSLVAFLFLPVFFAVPLVIILGLFMFTRIGDARTKAEPSEQSD